MTDAPSMQQDINPGPAAEAICGNCGHGAKLHCFDPAGDFAHCNGRHASDTAPDAYYCDCDVYFPGPDPAAEALCEIAAENAVVALEAGAERDGWAVYIMGNGDKVTCGFSRGRGYLYAHISHAAGGGNITRAEAVAFITAHKMAVAA